MKKEVHKIVKKSLESFPDVDDIDFEVEVPKRKGFGDFSTNAALILASRTGNRPRDIAQKIVDNILETDCQIIEKLEVAGPGFINFFLKDETFVNQLKGIYAAADTYGSSNIGQDERVIVEFVSANPTGYLHFGHARNAAVGDSISRILSFCGYEVEKEFYINDAGMQMEMLGKSVLARYREITGNDFTLPEDGYRGEYVIEIARRIHGEKNGQLEKLPSHEAENFCRDYAYSFLLDEIKKDLADLRVEFDNWYSEKEKIHDLKKLEEIEEKLMEKSALENKEGALWFKATEYGDNQDWVLIKSDGSPTYFLSDIAYHQDKYQRGYKKLVNIWGADHHSHFNRLRASMKALGHDETTLDVLLIQFVRLVEDGIEVAMSKRAGSYVTLRDVLSEVGADVTRFFLLMRSSDSHLDFDLNLAKSESSENPVYYIQYVYARISSILKNAEDNELKPSDNNINLLTEEPEQDLMKKLLGFPEIVKSAAETLSPHKICYYLQELASDFHQYYNKVKIADRDRPDLSSARLYLIICTGIVIKNGLTLLGVNSPQRM